MESAGLLRFFPRADPVCHREGVPPRESKILLKVEDQVHALGEEDLAVVGGDTLEGEDIVGNVSLRSPGLFDMDLEGLLAVQPPDARSPPRRRPSP